MAVSAGPAFASPYHLSQEYQMSIWPFVPFIVFTGVVIVGFIGWAVFTKEGRDAMTDWNDW